MSKRKIFLTAIAALVICASIFAGRSFVTRDLEVPVAEQADAEWENDEAIADNQSSIPEEAEILIEEEEASETGNNAAGNGSIAAATGNTAEKRKPVVIEKGLINAEKSAKSDKTQDTASDKKENTSGSSNGDKKPADAPNIETNVTEDIKGLLNADRQLTEAVYMESREGIAATVPAGVKVAEGFEKLSLSITEKAESDSDVTVEETERLDAYDIHIEGIAADNTKPIIIELGEVLSPGLNQGNLSLYHVEKDQTVKMTEVADKADFTAHNQFAYDPQNGALAVAMVSFSEITVVSDTEAKWEGNYDYSWYTDAVSTAEGEITEYVIANADQLAGFSAIVGGMNEQTKDNFSGKTVKLISDINLGDAETENNENLIFYPIGYYNSTGSYTRTAGTITSNVSSFSGTFDGNGHKISNIYQNTWEMFGDYNSGYPENSNYYKDAMGLFGYVNGGTVRNLTVDNFSSDGEFTPTGVIAAYAVNSTFENIAITNCNPRVYNTGNGGIVGIGGNSDDPDTYKLTFQNITIDNTNKISALWGSWDVACGGLVGMFRGAGHVYMTNCHVAAQMDVYNDVCGNYQYYWYRYAGMMVGTNKNMITDENGYTVPETDKFHAEDCTVHFGEWNDYYYCELVANSLASYTHDHQFSRLEQISSLDEIKNGDTWTKTGNFLLIDGDTKTCYHIVKDTDGTLKQHLHADAGVETVDGKTVLKEDKQVVYLPFNQLFTGYGWGVKHVPVYNGEDYAFDGITILDRESADSVVKFNKADSVKESYKTETTVTIGELFKAASITDENLSIKSENVQVTVSPAEESSTASGSYTPDTADWTKGTLTFAGLGKATVTITDYYFCTPTTIQVVVEEPDSVDKFDIVFENTDSYLYRVGNQNAVALGSLFKAIGNAEIGNVTVNVAALNDAEVGGSYTANASDWTKGTIQFGGTGPVKVTITDDAYANEAELYLEVIDAKNITTAEGASSNDVVLLNDISGTFTVSNGHTFYGNGFTVTLPTTSVQNIGNGFTGYISIGAAQDDGTANGGNLDNVRIEGPVYPEMYIYRDQAKITDSSDPDYGDGYNMRYFKNSVIIYGGNCTISNSYISGSRTALCLRGGNNVVIENTTLSGGAYANMQICAGSSVTLRDLTTVQGDVADSYGKGKTAHGLGIAVDSAVVDVYIEGELNQYNWLCEEQWNKIVPTNYQSVFPKFFTNNDFSKYWHYLNDNSNPYVNMAFIYACNWDTSKIYDNRTMVDYGTCDATIAAVSGGVYSKVNTAGDNAITETDLEAPDYLASGFNPVAPTFTFDNTANDDEDDANDAADTYCVYEESSGTLKIGVTGDGKTLDLSGIKIAKNGKNLEYTAYLNGTQISGNSVTINTSDGAKQTLTFKATSTDAGYDKDGNPIEGSIEYTWTVTVEVATLAYPAPVWNMSDYQFDTTNCVYAYYKTSQGYGEAVPIYEGIKVNYYDKSGTLVELNLSGTATIPTGSENSNSNAFTHTLEDGSTLTMKYSSGWKSGATTHQFTNYKDKVYIYPQSLDNDNYVRAKTTNQDFDVKISYNFTDPNGQSTGEQTMQWYNAKESNGAVTTVQWKAFDSTNGKEDSCLTPDTLITLADGTQKEVQYLNPGEELLVWNLETGSYDTAPTVFVDTEAEQDYTIVNCCFSDGSKVGIIYEHGFFDLDLGKYVYITAENYEEYIGHRFVAEGDKEQNTWNVVTLDSVNVETKTTTAWSPVTFKHLCYYTDGVLSMPGGISGLFNIFDVDTETMAYDPVKKEADIAEYGLYTFEDYQGIIPEIAYEAFNGEYLKVAIGKGLLTWDTIIEYAERYIPLVPSTVAEELLELSES